MRLAGPASVCIARALFALAAVELVLFALAACSRPAPPPGRWEGAYDSNGTMVVARIEIEAGGLVRLSAPDLSGTLGASDEQRRAIRAGLAARLLNGWDDVAPRAFDFDGKTFRKPGGIAPQLVWDKTNNQMTVMLYLGNQPAIPVPLHAVNDFSADPWPAG